MAKKKTDPAVEAKFQEWITVCKKWSNTLWLHDHHIEFVLLDKIADDPDDTHQVAAEVTVESRYKLLTVRVSQEWLMNKSTDSELLDRIALHEMLHAVQGPLYDFTDVLLDHGIVTTDSTGEMLDEVYKIAKETVTTNLTNSIWGMSERLVKAEKILEDKDIV